MKNEKETKLSASITDMIKGMVADATMWTEHRDPKEREFTTTCTTGLSGKGGERIMTELKIKILRK